MSVPRPPRLAVLEERTVFLAAALERRDGAGQIRERRYVVRPLERLSREERREAQHLRKVAVGFSALSADGVVDAVDDLLEYASAPVQPIDTQGHQELGLHEFVAEVLAGLLEQVDVNFSGSTQFR